MRSWGKQLIRLQFKSRLNYVEIISENAANQSTLKKKKKKLAWYKSTTSTLNSVNTHMRKFKEGHSEGVEICTTDPHKHTQRTDRDNDVTFTFISYQHLDISTSNLLFNNELWSPSDWTYLTLLSFPLSGRKVSGKVKEVETHVYTWLYWAKLTCWNSNTKWKV